MVRIQTLGMHERHRDKNNELVFRIVSASSVKSQKFYCR
jgi:hypothetical protein